MTFLNAILAMGAAAFTVPLVIHLLNRSRFQTLDWGAMEFLVRSVESNSRRLQWKEWLLLLIRCMIPIVLALTMARPMITAWRDSGVSNAIAMAVVLDDSLSMQSSIPTAARGEGMTSPSRLTMACRELQSLADQLPQGSSICLIESGHPIAVTPDLDAGSWKQALDRIAERKHAAGLLDWNEGVQQGLAWLSNSQLPKRHVLIVSDFSVGDWKGDSAEQLQRLQSMIQGMPVRPSIAFWNASDPGASGVPNKPTVDASITSMDWSPSQIAIQTDVSISVSLQNHGTVPMNAPILLFDGTSEIERQRVVVPPQSSLSTRFHWKPHRIGDAELKVRLDVDDATPADNELTRVIRVEAPIPVLIVDGARTGQPMQSESDFLRLALSPFALLQGQPGDVFATRVMLPSEWNETILKEYGIVVFCNVDDLTREQRALLRAHAEKGAGVVFALGDRVQPERYKPWESVEQGGLLPGKLQAYGPWEGGVRMSAAPFFALSEVSRDSLATVQVQRRGTMQWEGTDRWVGFEYEDGAPWIVSAPVGSGRCLWILSSIDDDDSNFPARPVYLPLMQKLLLFASSNHTFSSRVDPGSLWTEEWIVPTDVPKGPWQMAWLTGDGESGNVPLQESGNRYDDKKKVRSEWKTPRTLGVVQTRFGDQVRKVAIDIDAPERRRELQRALLDPNEFTTMAQSIDASPVVNATQWMDSMRSRWSGRELWTWFWCALILLCLAEMALQQWFRRSPVPHQDLSNSDLTPQSRDRRGAA